MAAPMVFPTRIKNFTFETTPAREHGSRICQIIASQSPLMMGVAPACELYVARAVSSRKRWEPLLRAVRWAMEMQADVLNMSFAFDQHSPELFRELIRLDDTGCILVASWTPRHDWPHMHPSVLSVSGHFLERNADIAAGALSVPGLLNHRGELFQGTSVSAALVSGVAACAKAYDPTLRMESFVEQIRQQGTLIADESIAL